MNNRRICTGMLAGIVTLFAYGAVSAGELNLKAGYFISNKKITDTPGI